MKKVPGRRVVPDFRKGGGRGPGQGPPKYCVCPSCGEKVLHKMRIPCSKIKCPVCATIMTRG